MKAAGIVFPHQLLEHHPLSPACAMIFLVEEYLFFTQYNFHRQKIAFHRATMKFYEQYLLAQGFTVSYIEAGDERANVHELIAMLAQSGFEHVEYIDTTDNWLEKRIHQACRQYDIGVTQHANPSFINTKKKLADFFDDKQRFFQTEFYIHQRLSRHILLEKGTQPMGGKWSFDADNRLKYPSKNIPPLVTFPAQNSYHAEAVQYTQQHYPHNQGVLNEQFRYPATFAESRQWLHDFFRQRFAGFGSYEDAIVAKEHVLHHSVLSPLLNCGLLTPQTVIDEALAFASEHAIPLNSLEGFLRQLIGWREFIRAIYELKGVTQRKNNFWKFSRPIPASFRNGTTGIDPVDITIRKVLKTGYCHHIERLMVLGNFMLLCEFDPDEVYQWFMELFIDAYDWVMVPNVYGMSQFSDGGLMSTKPYISGSNYLVKMSDFKKGDWQKTWDGLFWRFLHTHRDFFTANPRLSMLISNLDKMDPAKQQVHFEEAEIFLAGLE